jgi:thiol-disulfide isomerase/thioredoxin
VNIDFEIRIILVAAVVLAALVAGLVWRSRTGHSKKVSNGQQIDLAELGATKNGQPVTAFGERLTFLQFSSEFCSQCVQTARVYKDLEQHSEGILHIEVDITNRLDLAKKYNILQTPTTLVLDASGRVTSRIGGAAKEQTIKDEIGHFNI